MTETINRPFTVTELDVDIETTPACEGVDDETGWCCPNTAVLRLHFELGCDHAGKTVLCCRPCYDREITPLQWLPGAWLCIICGKSSTLINVTRL